MIQTQENVLTFFRSPKKSELQSIWNVWNNSNPVTRPLRHQNPSTIRFGQIVPEGTDRNCYDERYLTSAERGIGIKFSTSNNFTSLNGHWLKYCHCASMHISKVHFISISRWKMGSCLSVKNWHYLLHNAYICYADRFVLLCKLTNH